MKGFKRFILEGIQETKVGGLVWYAEAVMKQGFAVQSTEIIIPGAVAIVWQYAYVDLILLRDASAVLEAVIRTRVGLIGNGRSFGG